MEILENVRRQLENIQKFRKLDKLKRVVQKDGTTSVLYKNISKKRGATSMISTPLCLTPPGPIVY